MRFLIAAVLFTLIPISLCSADDPQGFAKVYYVGNGPGNDFATIQAAINACYDTGGLIIVRNGVYNEDLTIDGNTLNLNGSSIHLESYSGDYNYCIIKAKNDPNECPAVLIRQANVRIEGFTIKNGKGHEDTDNSNWRGGGIAANPYEWLSIKNCKITDNNITRYYSNGENYMGGGVYIGHMDEYGHPTGGFRVAIRDCVFYGNYTYAYDVGDPPWVHLHCYGGALCALKLSASSVIENCTFDSNISYDHGGAVYLGECNGIKVDSCDFTNNKVYSAGGDLGNATAFQAYNFGNKLVFTNNKLYENGDNVNYFRPMEAVCVEDVPFASFNNNTIVDNMSTYSYPVKFIAKNVTCTIDAWQNIICENDSYGAQVRFISEYEDYPLYYDLSYNCHFNSTLYETLGDYTEAGYVGNNTNGNPYLNGEYDIAGTSSSCLDTGFQQVPEYASDIPGWDIHGTTRPVDGNETGGSQWDMGAHEYVPEL